MQGCKCFLCATVCCVKSALLLSRNRQFLWLSRNRKFSSSESLNKQLDDPAQTHRSLKLPKKGLNPYTMVLADDSEEAVSSVKRGSRWGAM